MTFTAPKLLQNTVSVTSDRKGTIASYGFQTRELMALFRDLLKSITAAYSDADPISPIAITPSPMTYTATSRLSVHVVNGTVTALTFVRGTASLPLPLTNGQLIPLNPGDQLVIGYTAAPNLTAVPR